MAGRFGETTLDLGLHSVRWHICVLHLFMVHRISPIPIAMLSGAES